jgi:hypothetical protein
VSANLDTLERVAKRLGALKDDVVFVGGAVTELLVTDPGAPEPRMTGDIDAIVEVATAGEYYAFSEQLRAAGFAEDRSEEAPVCRWVVDGIKVDLMPPDERILGFSNRWYGETIRNAVVTRLPGGTEVRVVTAPYFLAIKLEAFAGRGKGDFAASHDIEDFIAVVDGRPELREEILNAAPEPRKYLSERIAALLQTDAFLDCIPGHLPPDEASQERVPIVLERLRTLTDSATQDATRS